MTQTLSENPPSYHVVHHDDAQTVATALSSPASCCDSPLRSDLRDTIDMARTGGLRGVRAAQNGRNPGQGVNE